LELTLELKKHYMEESNFQFMQQQQQNEDRLVNEESKTAQLPRYFDYHNLL